MPEYVNHLLAVRYVKTVEHVSTRPVKLECEDASGKKIKCYVKRDGDYHPHFREALCAHIAHQCKIPAPEWYVIKIDEELCIPAQPGFTPFAPGSLVFGTRAMDEHGYQPATFIDYAPGVPRSEEYEIYLLDAIVQNKDRTIESPNLLYHDNQGFMAIDHEFTLGARSPSRSFEDSMNHEYHDALARSHLLTPRLRFRPTACWSKSQTAYGGITHHDLMTFIAGLPQEWLPSVEERDMVVSKLNCIRNGMEHFAALLTSATFLQRHS